jgi:two-component system CheB/CheR fusion protein
MLTMDLHIRQFTPPMQKLVSVLPSDIGRSISDIRLQLSIEDLEPLLRHVLDTLSTHESEVQDREGRWFLLRIRPYRTFDNKIEGLVVVLLDIDQLRSSQQRLMEARDFSRSVVESVPVPVVVLGKDCTILMANTAFRELTQSRTSDLAARSLPDLVQLHWGLNDLGPRLEDVLRAEAGASFSLEHTSTNSDRKILLIRGQALATDGDRVLLLVMEDITLRRQAELMMSRQNEDLEGEVRFAARELDRTQHELRSLTGHLFTVQEEERQRVARELHDDVGQRLSLLALLLNSFEDGKLDPELKEKIHEANSHLQVLSTDVRGMSHQLHPAILDDLGISAALKSLLEDFGKRENMPATFMAREVPILSPQPATTAIYRITQEALRNVAKHAGRTHVKVLLEAREGMLHLEVRDLGIGFDVNVDGEESLHGLGMITMKERARLAHGTLSIESTLGQGTIVIADITHRGSCLNDCSLRTITN